MRKLKEILNIEYGVFRNVHNICSHECLLTQLAYLVMGAVSYNVNDKEHKNMAKVMIIERIRSICISGIWISGQSEFQFQRQAQISDS